MAWRLAADGMADESETGCATHYDCAPIVCHGVCGNRIRIVGQQMRSPGPREAGLAGLVQCAGAMTLMDVIGGRHPMKGRLAKWQFAGLAYSALA